MILDRLGVMTLGAAIALLNACRTPQAQWDATHLRTHAMDYYNDQIMDNLVRAQHGLAFIHVDISGLNSTVTTGINGTYSGGETTVNSGTRQLSNQAAVTDTAGATLTHA